MRSGVMQSLIHHTLSRESPPIAADANGVPLSLRIRSGSPYSQNAASNTRLLASRRSPSSGSHRIRKRLDASEIVSGWQYRRLTLNLPLKSVHHTTFGAVAAARG
jgi:hypothetical protein